MSSGLDVDAKLHELIPLLSSDQKRAILDRVEELVGTRKPSGVSGAELAKLSGIMSRESAEELKRVIEEDCERIDPESW